ncbi:MAG: 6-carboxytetrahydropterin synthase [Salinisphaera sp.]|nr:6-carboxytetrahydropterin synthase [Salinisphaera sp.]
MLLFVEQLTVIDCGLLDAARGLVGMSWLVDVSLQGEPDPCGMILDFGPAKRLIKNRIDRLVDHRLLVPTQADGLLRRGDQLQFEDHTGHRLVYRGPSDSTCLLASAAITADAVAAHVRADLERALPAGLHIEVSLREETIAGASYNYCHGLSQHGGNCQRIGHGHRCRLEILADGLRTPALERAGTARWQDVFAGNRADLANDPGDARYRFAYRSAAGDFVLELDAQRCRLLQAPTTVENIALCIARGLKREQPDTHFLVRAYEGVRKGAVAEA